MTGVPSIIRQPRASRRSGLSFARPAGRLRFPPHRHRSLSLPSGPRVPPVSSVRPAAIHGGAGLAGVKCHAASRRNSSYVRSSRIKSSSSSHRGGGSAFGLGFARSESQCTLPIGSSRARVDPNLGREPRRHISKALPGVAFLCGGYASSDLLRQRLKCLIVFPMSFFPSSDEVGFRLTPCGHVPPVRLNRRECAFSTQSTGVVMSVRCWRCGTVRAAIGTQTLIPST
jgi:hypothetical protein